MPCMFWRCSCKLSCIEVINLQIDVYGVVIMWGGCTHMWTKLVFLPTLSANPFQWSTKMNNCALCKVGVKKHLNLELVLGNVFMLYVDAITTCPL
jgi:hypothetical protein